jgi:hypothetical protein
MKRCIGRMGVFALSVLAGCGILLSKAASPLATVLSHDFVSYFQRLGDSCAAAGQRKKAAYAGLTGGLRVRARESVKRI